MHELVPITFNKIMQSKSYTVFILGTNAKKFAIYTEPHIGQNIQLHLTNKKRERPYTHDLINSIFSALSIQVLQVVIWNVEDTVYFAKLFLEQELDGKRNILEIDCRPSDCLTLALENDIPIYCTKGALDKIIPVEAS